MNKTKADKLNRALTVYIGPALTEFSGLTNHADMTVQQAVDLVNSVDAKMSRGQKELRGVKVMHTYQSAYSDFKRAVERFRHGLKDVKLGLIRQDAQKFDKGFQTCIAQDEAFNKFAGIIKD